MTRSRNAGTAATEPTRWSMCSTASLAPPCSGPYSAAAAAASAQEGSTRLEPTPRMVAVEQFYSGVSPNADGSTSSGSVSHRTRSQAPARLNGIAPSSADGGPAGHSRS